MCACACICTTVWYISELGEQKQHPTLFFINTPYKCILFFQSPYSSHNKGSSRSEYLIMWVGLLTILTISSRRARQMHMKPEKEIDIYIYIYIAGWYLLTTDLAIPTFRHYWAWDRTSTMRLILQLIFYAVSALLFVASWTGKPVVLHVCS